MIIPEIAKPTVVSLFTGAMGLDLGFEKHGFEVRVALDNDTAVGATIQANHRIMPVVTKNLSDIATSTILELSSLRVGEATVVTGAPPCEPFTTAGARNGFRDHRANAIYEFIRVVKEARPHYFVFEEVPGFLRSAKRHISFYERAKLKAHQIEPDARLGSAFEEVMEDFQSLGYHLSFDANNPKSSLLNSADYGSPQKRIRFVLIGALHGRPITLPESTHSSPESTAVSEGKKLRWATLRDALAGLDSKDDEWVTFPEKWGQYLHMVPPGGCWRDLPADLHPIVLGGAHDDGTDPSTSGMKGGRTGFLRRLSWDRPSPTLVDRPTNKANCLCHPDETRPLSVKEYARIQGFDDHWKFAGSLSQRYRLIGQATPIHLSTAVAARILEHRMGSSPENGHEEAHYSLIPLESQLEFPRDQVLR